MKYEKGSIGYFLDLAKKDGFDNLKDWNEWRKKNGKMPNHTKIDREYYDKLLQKKGFKSQIEYYDYLAKRDGYKDDAEYQREKYWNRGDYSPMSENENCPAYLGVYIGEDIAKIILIDIFGGIEKSMRYRHPSYEYIVKGGYKIDVKTIKLDNKNRCIFPIKYNKIADYFLLIAFRDIENLNIEHIWLIKGNDIVRDRKLNQFSGLSITNNIKNMLMFKKYLWTDKSGKLKEYCNKIKNCQ